LDIAGTTPSSPHHLGPVERLAVAATVVADWPSDVLETGGTAARNGLDTLAGRLERVPGVGRALRFVTHWLATIVSALVDLVSTVLKAVIEIAIGLVVAALRLAGGGVRAARKQQPRRTLARGAGDAVAGLAGPVLLSLGKTVALAQSAVCAQTGDRRLRPEEAEVLRSVYRGSVALYNVRIVDGFAGVFSVNPRPFTLGNTIYMKHRPPEKYLSTLVHECAHVWQNQHAGARYAVQALWAQGRLGHGAYDWAAEPSRGRHRWQDFNREAQAQLFEHVWKHGRRGHLAEEGAFFTDEPVGDDVELIHDGVDHTALAKAAVAHVRAARSRRPSARFV
jgi:hypothetical protein